MGMRWICQELTQCDRVGVLAKGCLCKLWCAYDYLPYAPACPCLTNNLTAPRVVSTTTLHIRNIALFANFATNIAPRYSWLMRAQALPDRAMVVMSGLYFQLVQSHGYFGGEGFGLGLSFLVGRACSMGRIPLNPTCYRHLFMMVRLRNFTLCI